MLLRGEVFPLGRTRPEAVGLFRVTQHRKRVSTVTPGFHFRALRGSAWRIEHMRESLLLWVFLAAVSSV